MEPVKNAVGFMTVSLRYGNELFEMSFTWVLQKHSLKYR